MRNERRASQIFTQSRCDTHQKGAEWVGMRLRRGGASDAIPRASNHGDAVL